MAEADTRGGTVGVRPLFYLSKFFSEELALSAITNTTATTTTIQYYR